MFRQALTDHHDPQQPHLGPILGQEVSEAWYCPPGSMWQRHFGWWLLGATPMNCTGGPAGGDKLDDSVLQVIFSAFQVAMRQFGEH